MWFILLLVVLAILSVIGYHVYYYWVNKDKPWTKFPDGDEGEYSVPVPDEDKK